MFQPLPNVTSGRDLGLEGSDLCRVFSAWTPWSGQLGGRSVFWKWVWGPETTSLAEAQSSQGICERSRRHREDPVTCGRHVGQGHRGAWLHIPIFHGAVDFLHLAVPQAPPR